MTSPGILNNQDKKEQEPLKRRAREIKEEYEPGAKTLLQFEEEERETIAREIHDDLSQPLTAIKINLSGLLRLKFYSAKRFWGDFRHEVDDLEIKCGAK